MSQDLGCALCIGWPSIKSVLLVITADAILVTLAEGGLSDLGLLF